jgi:hypothetical protein
MRAFIDQHNNLILLADSRKDRDWLTQATTPAMVPQSVGSGFDADGNCLHLTIAVKEKADAA